MFGMPRKRTAPLRSAILTLTLTLATAAALLLVVGSASGVQGRVLDSGPATVYVDPDALSVSRCGTFTVAVSISDLPDDLYSYQFTMGFSPDVVTVSHVVDQRFVDGGFMTHLEIAEDSVFFFAVANIPEGETGTDADGPLAVVELEAVGLGPSDLILSNVVLGNEDADRIAYTVQPGAVDVTKEASHFAFDPVPSPRVAGEPFDVTITALNDEDSPAVSFSGIVELSDTTGTLAPTEIYFDGPEVTASMTITRAEQGVIITAQAQNLCGMAISGESNPFVVEPDVESPVAVTIYPHPRSVTAGESVTYTLTAVDAFGNTWDVTDEADFAIDEDAGGAFDENVYTSQIAGTWTVTGTYNVLTDTATLIVLEHAATSVSIEPEAETLTAGQSVTYTLTAADDFGNTWDVTAEAAFAIDQEAGGGFDANVYTSQVAGQWTVTGSYGVLTTAAALTVERAAAASLALEPDPETVTAGQSVTYTLTAADDFGNAWDVTHEADFAIDQDAGGEFVANIYTSQIAGAWTVTGTYETLIATAALTVERAGVASLALEPDPETVTAGQSVTYTLTAADDFGNAWDVTDEADFAIDEEAGGGFVANVYTSQVAGQWTVTATYEALMATAALTVTPDVAIRLTFEPIVDQMVNEPFSIVITAYDNGTVATSYHGTASLDDTTGTITPLTVTFTSGVFSGEVTIAAWRDDVIITATDTTDPELLGVSNTFAVKPSRIFLPLVVRSPGS